MNHTSSFFKTGFVFLVLLSLPGFSWAGPKGSSGPQVLSVCEGKGRKTVHVMDQCYEVLDIVHCCSGAGTEIYRCDSGEWVLAKCTCDNGFVASGGGADTPPDA